MKTKQMAPKDIKRLGGRNIPYARRNPHIILVEHIYCHMLYSVHDEEAEEEEEVEEYDDEEENLFPSVLN